MESGTASDFVEMDTKVKCEIIYEEDIKTEIFDNFAAEHEIYDLKNEDCPMNFKTSVKIEDTTNSGDSTDYLCTVDFKHKTNSNEATSDYKFVKGSVKKNRKKTNSNTNTTIRSKRKKKRKEDITYACGFCSKTFLMSKAFFSHMECHSHGYKNNIMESGTENNSNNPKNECGKITKNIKSSLQKCKDTTKRKKAKPNEIFQCDVCPQIFTFKSNLHRHKLLHAENKRQRPICDICKKSYNKKGYLIQHIQRVHFKVKSDTVFVCDVCERTVTTAYALRCHMQIHTGHKPFECNWCNKGFSNKWNLKIHMKSHEL